ncbi:hypothetical protein ABZP36_016705 [Zizania latifolia]
MAVSAVRVRCVSARPRPWDAIAAGSVQDASSGAHRIGAEGVGGGDLGGVSSGRASAIWAEEAGYAAASAEESSEGELCSPAVAASSAGDAAEVASSIEENKGGGSAASEFPSLGRNGGGGSSASGDATAVTGDSSVACPGDGRGIGMP